MTLDIKKAYRGAPIHVDDKKFLICAHRGMFWIDHTVPFGLCSAGDIQGVIAHAIMAIWRKLGVKQSEKWVNDCVIFRQPIAVETKVEVETQLKVVVYSYVYNRESAKVLVAPLGTPWHLRKGQEPDYTFIYIGFLWNLPGLSVQLTRGKWLKVVRKLEEFIDLFKNSKISLQDAMSLNGSLSHISFVCPNGSAYLTSLSTFITSYNVIPEKQPKLRWAPRSLFADLEWWRTVLREWPAARCLQPRVVQRDLGIWVDAST